MMGDALVDTMTPYGPLAPEPPPTPVGTFDLGTDREAAVRRVKALAHALVHYNLPSDGKTQCPYCGGLLLEEDGTC